MICRSGVVDPYYNLALEQYLLESVEDTVILYLWQNENTVVIGRNQNPWKECRTALLEQEGGRLARRLSGGGAVFHDLGNLNFTFLMPQRAYDLNRQLSVIETALRSLGIQAERSGRNDILADGRKFSGNAFYQNGRRAYHHGTLLVDVDMEKLSRYLSPSKAKLTSKGVDSVRSRVVNLKELRPELTLGALEEALERAFAAIYAQPLRRLDPALLDQTAIGALAERNRSWQWLYGRQIPFALSCEERFAWGAVQLELAVENGHIGQVRVYSDAMDWQLAPRLEEALRGCRLSREALEARLCGGVPEIAGDLLRLLCEKVL